MEYAITLCVGMILGVIITSILIVGSNSEKLEEAYNEGFNDGKISVLNNE